MSSSGGRSSTRKIRRLVAEGARSSQAVSEAVPPVTGPLARVSKWQALEAGRVGMNVPLWQLLQRDDVSDVVINGTSAWADFGRGLEPVEISLRSPGEVRRLAIHMAASAMRRLDDSSPIVDAVLAGSIRLHAVLPPLSQSGTAISLRVLRRIPFTLPELVLRGAVHRKIEGFLERLVLEGRSILISGATGTGKTTLLATLLGLTPKAHRIVAIEEVNELSVSHPHVVYLQARPPNIEGEGGLGLEELVRAAVRMRPDRLVLGECRGAEVREVLTALNTGHRGGFATLHANSVEDVPARLFALGMLGGLDQ